MDIKFKYRAWVGEKHADIASPLTNSDIEHYATEFAEWLVKNCFIPDVVGQSEQLKCHHQYMNAGTLQGQAMKKCLKCGDYVKAL